MRKQFQVHILGCSAATPTSLRHTSAQLLQYHNTYMMLDCSEGAQMQLRRYKLPLMKIDHIFISHLHGDHYLGLPGLLFSYHLLNRKKDIHVYGPEGIEKIMAVQFEVANFRPSYQIRYHIISEGKQRLYESKNLSVESIAMEHRIPTYGFLIKEKINELNIKKEAIVKFNIPVEQILNIKAGKDYINDKGETISNQSLTFPPLEPRSYAFCADTGYTEKYIEQIKKVDVLYHEATFLRDKEVIAREKAHCTAFDAASIALKAEAKKLVLGHYSARYDETESFKAEASQTFKNEIIVAEEGSIVSV